MTLVPETVRSIPTTEWLTFEARVGKRVLVETGLAFPNTGSYLVDLTERNVPILNKSTLPVLTLQTADVG